MINRFKWLEVKPETRRNISAFLGLKHTGMVEVSGNKVVCDGFTDNDLCAITPELLKKMLDESTFKDYNVDSSDIYSMFYELVRRMQLPVVEVVKDIDTTVVDVVPLKKKLGRPKKAN